jgi:propionyl-CoA carboxylase beta chain
MKIKALLEDLEKRRATARAGGGQDKLEARRKKGVMTARDR